MKTLITFITFISFFTCAHAQEILGTWHGSLKIQSVQLRIVLHVNQDNYSYSATLDSPDQGVKGIPVTSISFENATLKFAVASIGAQYEGTWKNDSIIGTFQQRGQLPLAFARGEKKLARPQEPKKPYPYQEEEVSFENTADKVTLAGTLTMPQGKGPFPVVILISGSGQQNRDEELMGHKPFLVLADHLTKNGIAVLRYDDRGVSGSTGDFKSATSVDFSMDVGAAFEYLKNRKEISKKHIGLIGHSEGGMIAPMVAARNKEVSFIVLLAGPGVTGERILLSQQRLIAKASGATDVMLDQSEKINKGAFEIVKNTDDVEQMKADLSTYLKANGLPDNAISASLNQMTSPWMKFFMTFDPATALQKVRCPVLALNGEKDLQVPARENLDAIQSALSKNKKVTVKELAGLNHLFQECTTGLPYEYGQIEQTFSLNALSEVSGWINSIALRRQ